MVPAFYQWLRLVVVYWCEGVCSCHTLGPSEPTDHRFNTTVYLSFEEDHLHPFRTTVGHLLMDTSTSSLDSTGLSPVEPV